VIKQAAPPLSYDFRGRLVLSKSGWLMLQVPNALVRGAFDAISEPGVELPTGPHNEEMNAHISVMRPEELKEVGGPSKITERGHEFRYTLGPLRVVDAPSAGLSKVWYIEVKSPELEKLRKSYGLSATPKQGRYQFHITVGQRRTHVLGNSDVTKTQSSQKDPFKDQGSQVRKAASFSLALIKAARQRKEGADHGQSTTAGSVRTGGEAGQNGSGRPGGGHAADQNGKSSDVLATKLAAAPVNGSSPETPAAGAGKLVDLFLPLDKEAVEAGRRDSAKVNLTRALNRAARKVRKPKSDAQAEAGNYPHGHLYIRGMAISLENRKDSIRSGTSPDGTTWKNSMAAHYGYVTRIYMPGADNGWTTVGEANDGDHVDCFVGDEPASEMVYVIDQVDPATGDFDEFKIMLGFIDRDSAKQAYLDSYDPGWKGLGNMTPLTMPQFKHWLMYGDRKKRIADQTITVKTAADQPPVLVLHRGSAICLVPGAMDCDGATDGSA
jgi:hypothetical protein